MNQWPPALIQAINVITKAASSCRTPPNNAISKTSALPKPCDISANPPTMEPNIIKLNKLQGKTTMIPNHQPQKLMSETLRSCQSAMQHISKPILRKKGNQVVLLIPKRIAKTQWTDWLMLVKRFVTLITVSKNKARIKATTSLHRINFAEKWMALDNDGIWSI